MREGRRREFAKWPHFASEEHSALIADPNAEATFEASKLDWDKLDQPAHRARLDFVQAAARRPAARDRAAASARSAAMPARFEMLGEQRFRGDAGGLAGRRRAVALRQSRRRQRGVRIRDDAPRRLPHRLRARRGRGGGVPRRLAAAARRHRRSSRTAHDFVPLPDMSDDLDRLAATVGIEPDYIALTGETRARLRRRQARRAEGDGHRRRRRGRDRREPRRASRRSSSAACRRPTASPASCRTG